MKTSELHHYIGFRDLSPFIIKNWEFPTTLQWIQQIAQTFLKVFQWEFAF